MGTKSRCLALAIGVVVTLLAAGAWRAALPTTPDPPQPPSNVMAQRAGADILFDRAAPRERAPISLDDAIPRDLHDVVEAPDRATLLTVVEKGRRVTTTWRS